MSGFHRTIAILNQKGGVGKTTSTVNLGAALAETGQRVLLVDLDPQAHLTLHLGVEAGDARTVYDVLVDSDCPAERAIVSDAESRPNLDVIPAEVDLAAAESELAGEPDRQRLLRQKLAPLLNRVGRGSNSSDSGLDFVAGLRGGAPATRYDVVLVDCPPSLGLLTLNALAAADEVFVPMQAHFLALQGVSKLLETVSLVSQGVNPAARVAGVILCMHEGQTTLAKEIVADLEAFFEQHRDHDVPWRDCRVLKPAIRRNIKLAEAPSFGKTIFEYEPWCPGALDYRKLAENVLAMWTEAEARGDNSGTGDGEDAGRDAPEHVPAVEIVTVRDEALRDA